MPWNQQHLNAAASAASAQANTHSRRGIKQLTLGITLAITLAGGLVGCGSADSSGESTPQPHPSSSSAADLSESAAQGLNTIMAGLHRTIYGYGLVGAQVSGAQRDQTRVFLQQLRSSRDELQPLILTLTQDLAAAAAGYEPESGVPQTAQEASALAHDMIQEFVAELEAQTAPVQTWVDSQEPSPIKQEVTQALSDLKKSATKQLEYWQQAP